jgi:predicted dehydrogenase
MTSNSLRTIVVGFGKIASGLETDSKMARHFKYATHAQVLRDHPNFDWLGVVEPSEMAQAAARQKWGIPYVSSELSVIVKEVNPEVIIITAPPTSRVQIIEMCTNLKAAFVEKPLNFGDQKADALIDICLKKDINLQVNFWRRGDELFQNLAAGKLSELIGIPSAVFATYGNGLRNNASHMIDFVRMILGEITSVQANAPAIPLTAAPLNGDIHLPFSLTLETGAVVAIHPIDFSNFREVGLDIWGSLGRLTILQEGLSVRHYPIVVNRALEDEFEVNSDNGTAIESTISTALYNLYENLYAATTSDAALSSSGTSALRTENIIDAILLSSREECEVKVLG